VRPKLAKTLTMTQRNQKWLSEINHAFVEKYVKHFNFVSGFAYHCNYDGHARNL